MRLDAEFFRPEWLATTRLLSERECKNLVEISKISDGNHFGISDSFTDEGIPYYRGQDATGRFFIEQSSPTCITREAYSAPHIVRSHLKPKDVLLSIVGTIGSVSLVSSNREATCNCKLAILRPKTLPPEALALFLKSRYGQHQIHRLTRGAVQMGLPLADFDQILVPSLGEKLPKRLMNQVKQAKLALDHSSDLRSNAENLLLEELGLSDWTPPTDLAYEATASQAFVAGRLDAEFFHPKYADVLSAIESKGAVRLGDYVKEKIHRGISPSYTEEGDYMVINSKHVGKSRISIDNTRLTNSDSILSRDLKRGSLKKFDVLLNSTGRDTLGRCQCYLHDAPAVADNHIAIIRPKKGLDPVYLSTFIHGLPGAMQTDRNYTGSSGQIELRPELIERYLIWLAPHEIQMEIRRLVETSETKRLESQTLLDRAVRAVEIAIEEGEEAGLAYLEDGKSFAETRIVPNLFRERPYIDTDGVREALKDAGLSYEPETVRKYLHEWTREGRIFDAGRGWYSNLSEAAALPPTEEMRRILDWWGEAFPLETCRIWSTEQTAPYQQHLPARHLVFLYVERDAMELAGRQLRDDLNLRVAIHPLGKIAETFETSDWDVVIRPLLKADSEPDSIALQPHEVLSDLAVEADALNLMGEFEYRTVFDNITQQYRIEIPAYLRRCKERNINASRAVRPFG